MLRSETELDYGSSYMIRNAIQQEYTIAIELEESIHSLETVHYRMESGFLAGHPARMFEPSSHTLPKATQDWFRLRREVEHHGLPKVIDGPTRHSDQGTVVESWQAGRSLDDYLEEQGAAISELSAVYLTLQAAMVLDKLLQNNAAIPVLKTDEFMIDDGDDGLPRMVYLGWRPPEFVPEGSWEPDALQFLARLLYRCLTGVQPPSEQVSALSPDLEEADLGFDDLFLTWVTEEKDMGALGEAALTALRPTQTGCQIASFISDVYPHLKRATDHAIEQAVQKLAADRELLSEVEQHRLALKEHRTRQRYLSGWLMDNEPKAVSDTSSVETSTAYLLGAKNYAARLRRKLSHSLKTQSAVASETSLGEWSTAPLPDDDRAANKAHSEEREEPLSFEDLAEHVDDYHADFDAHLAVEQPLEDASTGSELNDSLLESPSAPQAAVEQTNTNRTMLMMFLVLFIATFVGVFVTWSVLSYSGSHGEQTESSTMIEGDKP